MRQAPQCFRVDDCVVYREYGCLYVEGRRAGDSEQLWLNATVGLCDSRSLSRAGRLQAEKRAVQLKMRVAGRDWDDRDIHTRVQM